MEINANKYEKKDFYRSAKIIIEECCKVKSGENVLIVTDTKEPIIIGEALFDAVREVKAEPILMVYAARDVNPSEPPLTVGEAVKSSDVVLAYTSTSFTHTKARIEAQAKGIRVVAMPMLTEESFLRTVPVDIEKIAKLTNKLGKIMQRKQRVKITTKTGTNLEMEVSNKPILSDGKCIKKGDFDLVPFGVTVQVPDRDTAFGKVVVDGSITTIGKLSKPVVLTIEKGKAVKIDGGEEAKKLKRILAELNDKDAYTCPAEWGVGTNPKAKLLGNEPSMEGERIYGFAHVSLGYNASFPGGFSKAKIHLDCIFKNPTIEFNGKVILKDRKFII